MCTEQRSSASKMTADKVIDIIARLPGCAGQASDALSAYAQVKMGRCPIVIKNPKSEKVQTFGFVYHDTNGQNHGPAWKTQSFFLSGICTVIFWQDYYGKGNLKGSIETLLGNSSRLGMLFLQTEKKDFLLFVHVDEKIGWKETKH